MEVFKSYINYIRLCWICVNDNFFKKLFDIKKIKYRGGCSYYLYIY